MHAVQVKRSQLKVNNLLPLGVCNIIGYVTNGVKTAITPSGFIP